MKKLFIFVIVIAAIVYGVMFFSKKDQTVNNTSAPVETINTQTATTTENSVKGETYNISIKDFTFDQKTITINKGDTIVWKNIDNVPHQIQGTSLASLKGPVMGYGLTYSYTFNDAGTYDYFCVIHPMMKGTVIVK